MDYRAVAVILALLSATPAVAQDKLLDLERKIDALTHEVERLKLGAAAEPAAEGAAPSQAPAASKVYRAAERRVSIGGYGETSLQHFARRNQKADTPTNKRDEFDFIRAVLYAGYKFNDWILFNSELEFEHASTGKGRGEVSVEQAYIDFRLHDWFGVRAGMILPPMGFINEIHEPTTFHGVIRPAVERNIIPSTWRENGAGFFGEIGPVAYRTYAVTGLQAVSNTGVGGLRGSDGLRNGRSSGAKSFAEDAAWTSRVDVTPIPGVLAGGSLYIGEADHNFTAAAVPVTLWDLHARAEYRGAELRALYAKGRIGNADRVNMANAAAQTTAAAAATYLPGGTAGSGRQLFGGYVEAAFNVLSLGQSSHYLAPFFRYERYDTQQDVPDGWRQDPANSRVEYTVGVTYKPIPQVAVKGDYQWMLNQARTGVNQLNLGLGYIF